MPIWNGWTRVCVQSLDNPWLATGKSLGLRKENKCRELS